MISYTTILMHLLIFLWWIVREFTVINVCYKKFLGQHKCDFTDQNKIKKKKLGYSKIRGVRHSHVCLIKF